MPISVTWAQSATVVETLDNNTASAPDSTRKVTHTDFNEGGSLSATTAPAATKCAHFILTLTAGAASVDLTALTGTNGVSVNGTGLKVQLVRVKNLGANQLTIKVGASNGHTGVFAATNGHPLNSGGVLQIFTNGSGDSIDATHKVLDVTGTGAQTSEWTIVLG